MGGGRATGSTQCWLVGQPVHSSLLPPTMASVASDGDVFAQFKQQSRKQYVRMWSQFRDFIPDFDFATSWIFRFSRQLEYLFRPLLPSRIQWTFNKGLSQPSLLYLDCKLPM